MLVPVPLPPPESTAPPAPTGWAFLVGRRTRARLDLVIVYATPAPPASVAGGAT